MLTALLFAAAATSAQAKPWDQVYEQSKPSIPILLTRDGGECSGALIEPALILTARHCVATLRGVSVIWADAPRAYEADVVWMDQAHDLALVRLHAPSQRKPLAVIDASTPVKEGQAVATIGHPTTSKPLSSPPVDLDSTYLLSTGVISRVTEDDLLLDLSLSPGNSGGPVLDTEGRIVGVVSRKRIGPGVGDIGYVTAPNRIREVVQSLRKEGARSFSLFSAESTFSFELAFGWHSFIKEIGHNSSGNQVQWGFSVNLWDRLALFYRRNFDFTGDKYFYSYGVGYRLQIPLGNFTAIGLTPAYERIAYRFRNLPNGIAYGEGGTLTLQYAALPVGLRYSLWKVGDSTENAFTLVLGGRF
jgi:hypothetical protein